MLAELNYDIMITERDTTAVPASTPGSTVTLGTAPAPGIVVHVDLMAGHPTWFAGVVERLNHLTALEHNWDTYGGVPVTADVAGRALDVLADIGRIDTPPPSIVPIEDGGVQLEWHRGGLDVEIVIPPVGHATLYFAEVDAPEGGWEGPLVWGLPRFGAIRERMTATPAAGSIA